MKEAPAPPTLSRAPITKTSVRHFYLGASGFEGVIRDLSNELLARLDAGVVSFEIVDSAQDKSLLKTKWNKVSKYFLKIYNIIGHLLFFQGDLRKTLYVL